MSNIFIYEMPFRRLKESIDNDCRNSVMSIISSSCGQDYVNAMNQILTSIDGGIDNFETMYHIQPYMYDYNEIEWAREKLKEEYLIKLLDQLSSFANNIPNYQDVYDQVSYYVFKSI